jgi:hypothetical protein
MHGGTPKTELGAENLETLEKGIPNLLRHVSNIKNVYKLPCVVAVNRFPTDTDAEIQLVIDKCKALGVNVVAGAGDSYNDLPLLTAADVSYTFHTSPAQVRAAATNTVADLAEALGHFMQSIEQ